MTLAPLVNPTVRGVEGKPVLLQPGDRCVVPGCLSIAQQRHHMWPKSFLRGQPFEWVTVMSQVIPNTCGLCVRHHGWVTGEVGVGHRAKIVWDEGTGLLYWWERGEEDLSSWTMVAPLRGQQLLTPQPEAVRVRRQEGLCPSCGRLAPHEKVERERRPKRKLKTWVVGVPDDAEQGTDVLDTYIEDLAVIMGLDPDSPRMLRYHVLVPALEWVMQNRVEFLREWEAGR